MIFIHNLLIPLRKSGPLLLIFLWQVCIAKAETNEFDQKINRNICESKLRRLVRISNAEIRHAEKWQRSTQHSLKFDGDTPETAKEFAFVGVVGAHHFHDHGGWKEYAGGERSYWGATYLFRYPSTAHLELDTVKGTMAIRVGDHTAPLNILDGLGWNENLAFSPAALADHLGSFPGDYSTYFPSGSKPFVLVDHPSNQQEYMAEILRPGHLATAQIRTKGKHTYLKLFVRNIAAGSNLESFDEHFPVAPDDYGTPW